MDNKEAAEVIAAMRKHEIDILKINALELAIKALEQTPCTDAISRSEAIRVASGYCHWSNIPKELAKLPSVAPQQAVDAISRQAVNDLVDELARAISDERCCVSRGRSTATIMQDILDLPSVSTEKTGWWIPVSVIEDIKADIKGEYVSLRHRTDEDIELGETIGLKIALGIIDSHTIAKMEVEE